jgi:hypothetical protein
MNSKNVRSCEKQERADTAPGIWQIRMLPGNKRARKPKAGSESRQFNDQLSWLTDQA